MKEDTAKRNMEHATRSAHRVVPFSAQRQVVVDSLEIGARRHIVHGLIEVDVTQTRQFIREHKARTGETLSLTAFVAARCARAVDANKLVHAYRDWRNRLILFDEVDVVVMIEAEVDRFAIPHIIRAANKKTWREIHAEIRAVQSQPTKSAQESGGLARLGWIVPSFVRKFFLRLFMRNPHWMKKFGGTVVITSVGMFGRGGGWGLGMLPMHTLGHSRRHRGKTRRGEWAHRNPRISRFDDQRGSRYCGWRTRGAFCARVGHTD